MPLLTDFPCIYWPLTISGKKYLTALSSHSSFLLFWVLVYQFLGNPHDVMYHSEITLWLNDQFEVMFFFLIWQINSVYNSFTASMIGLKIPWVSLKLPKNTSSVSYLFPFYQTLGLFVECVLSQNTEVNLLLLEDIVTNFRDKLNFLFVSLFYWSISLQRKMGSIP